MASNRSEALADLILQDADAEDSREFELGPEEVAQILDRSPHDVAGLARKGKLRARRMGSHWKFSRHDVIAYLSDHSQIDKSI